MQIYGATCFGVEALLTCTPYYVLVYAAGFLGCLLCISIELLKPCQHSQELVTGAWHSGVYSEQTLFAVGFLPTSLGCCQPLF